MCRNIEEVKAEKISADVNQRKYIYDKPEQVFFPFTHCDSVDAARM